jgi:hypothetical protein
MEEEERPSRVTMFVIVFISACVSIVASNLIRGRTMGWAGGGFTALVMATGAALLAPYLPTRRR